MRARDFDAVVIAEQVANEVADLGLGHHVGPNRVPEASEREPREALGAAIAVETGGRLARVKVDVAPLLTHDPPQELAEHRMPGALSASSA